MRLREKLTVEEKVAIALELIKRERSLDEIRVHYRVSHTTAYKIRNQFLEGGRRALSRGERHDAQRSGGARARARGALRRAKRDVRAAAPGASARQRTAGTASGDVQRGSADCI